MVADEDKQALEKLSAALERLGHKVLARAVTLAETAKEIHESHPEIALVKLHQDDDHALRLIEELASEADCPVLAVLENQDEEFVADAAARGIAAYVQPVDHAAVQSAIEVAVRRDAERRHLAETVDQLEEALDRRGTIERAKGILMERHEVDEREAFEMLRDHARAHNRKLIDVARAVGEGHALLPGHSGD